MLYSTLYADLLFAYTFTLLLHQMKKLYYIFGLSKSHCHCRYLSVCLFAILSVNFTLLFTITHHRFQLEKLICMKHASWYILSVCINKEGHWQWPARSFLLFWLRIGKTPVRIILWCPITKMPIKACFLIQPLEQEGGCQKCCISLCSKVFINHFYQMKTSPEC